MSEKPLSVAVTGPTGEIGKSFIRALEREQAVGEIRGMARSEFDGSDFDWERTTYVRGDILDRGAVADFVADADVVVHLAFIIFGDREETRTNNLDGSRNVFEATATSGAKRLVYTSSVAAYGFHSDNPQPLTEDVEPRGSEKLYYSAQKAELETTMYEALEGTGVNAYVFRPSIVAGPESPALVENMPYVQASAALPARLRRILGAVPTPAPILPDFGTPLQLVHADDVASALVAGVLGKGKPGVYNLAASGEITIADVARELGWNSVSMPKAASDVTSELLDRLPLTPARAEWLHTLRTPVVMDTSRARTALGWKPQHDALETLRETVAATR
ncbi:NAD-dependent epimerase/dehydratase family protein [soil metagenome]